MRHVLIVVIGRVCPIIAPFDPASKSQNERASTWRRVRDSKGLNGNENSSSEVTRAFALKSYRDYSRCKIWEDPIVATSSQRLANMQIKLGT